MRKTLLAAAVAALHASGAGAQTLELEQRLRACLHEKAQHPPDGASGAAAKGSLQQKAEHLLGRCDGDKDAWLHACSVNSSRTDCTRRAEVRAVSALHDGKGSGKGGH
ncbi:MAG: hypothetical protein PGN34_16925 [Methylobacterium frigidaeris]